MPPSPTDAERGTDRYEVPPVEFPHDPDDPTAGDFRFLDIYELFERVMLEDDEGLDRAAAGWDVLGQQFHGAASALRSHMTVLADAWHSDAATLLGERVESAATSFDSWGYVAVGRAYELTDLADVVRATKSRLEQIWEEFVHATGVLLTPPATLGIEERQQWRREASGGADLLVRQYTHKALDEVVNPLANRFSEAALAFTVAGPVYAGPTNAAVPSDAALVALLTEGWAGDAPAAPPVPAVPAAPALRSPPSVPAVPAAPISPPVLAPVAPGTLTAARQAVVQVPGHAPAFPLLPGLVAASFVSLAGRRAAVSGVVPVLPGIPQTSSAPAGAAGRPAAAPGPVAAPSPGAPVHPGVPGSPGAAGRSGAAGSPDVPGRPDAAGSPGAPGDRRGSAPPVPHLPGRTGAASTPSGPPPPGARRPAGTPPQLGGRTTRTAVGEPPHPGIPAGTRLRGRGASAPGTSTPPPPTLGARRAPVRGQRPGGEIRTSRDPGRTAAGHIADDAAVPPSLRSGRGAPSRHEAGRPAGPTTGRHAAPTPDGGQPVGRTSGRRPRDEETVATRPSGRVEPLVEPATTTELVGRTAPADTPPTPAEERAADRARRRAEWAAARREQQSGTPFRT